MQSVHVRLEFSKRLHLWSCEVSVRAFAFALIWLGPTGMLWATNYLQSNRLISLNEDLEYGVYAGLYWSVLWLGLFPPICIVLSSLFSPKK